VTIPFSDTDEALVVFTEGYGHCFALVKSPAGWICLDGEYGRITLYLDAPPDYDIERYYQSCGCYVVKASLRWARFYSPITLASCVSMIKRLIGLRAPFVFTPRQLARKLEKINGISVQ